MEQSRYDEQIRPGDKGALGPQSSILQQAIETPAGHKNVSNMLMTVRQACEQLQLSKWTINRLIRSGELNSIKVGRRRLIPRDAISSFIERRAKEAEGPPYGMR